MLLEILTWVLLFCGGCGLISQLQEVDNTILVISIILFVSGLFLNGIRLAS